MTRILQILAAIVLGLFAAVWLWVAFQILNFQPSPGNEKVTFTDAQVMVAGFLASAVGAGTASVLGIEIQKVPRQNGGTMAFQVGEAARSSWTLTAGILTYAVVGVVVLVVWLAKSQVASDMVSAFALGVLGWLGGSFAAVFRKDT